MYLSSLKSFWLCNITLKSTIFNIQRVPSRYNNNYINRRNVGWSVGTTAIIVALVLGCCFCCCIIAFFKKAKEHINSKRSNDWDGNSSSNGPTGDAQFPQGGYGDMNAPNNQPAYPLYPKTSLTIRKMLQITD